VRRTVATLLVIASPLLLATPVSAGEDRLPAVQPAATPAPVVPAPVTLAPPALPAPAPVAVPAVTTPNAPSPVRHAVKKVRATAPKPAVAADLSDAAYAAQLQAQLCQARTIFCGLDRNGRYPGR
jgi:hypothetical protein